MQDAVSLGMCLPQNGWHPFAQRSEAKGWFANDQLSLSAAPSSPKNRSLATAGETPPLRTAGILPVPMYRESILFRWLNAYFPRILYHCAGMNSSTSACVIICFGR